MAFNLFEMQIYQHEHDQKYHQDILALGTPNRIKHLILHFTKYLGKLLTETEKNSKDTLSDIVICCLSLANVLNIQLSIDDERSNIFLKTRKEDFFASYVASISRMAKACEAVDHLESYPSRDTLNKEVRNLTFLTISYIQNIGYCLDEIIKIRLETIEKNNIFFDQNKKMSLSVKLSHLTHGGLHDILKR